MELSALQYITSRWIAATAQFRAMDVLLWLEKRGANVNAEDPYGRMPMHLAAEGGHVEAMKRLKEQGANVNAEVDYNGRTPIYWAASRGHIEAMKWLKEQGVDVNAKSNRGWYGGTLMHAAAGSGHVEVMKWLKEQGADINAKNDSGWTATIELRVNVTGLRIARPHGVK